MTEIVFCNYKLKKSKSFVFCGHDSGTKWTASHSWLLPVMLLPTSKWSNLFHILLHYITFLAWPKKLVSVPLPFIWSPEDKCSQSGFPVIFWLLRILSLISVRNFQTIVCDAWKPTRCTIVTGWKRRARPSGRPRGFNHMHCLLQGIREWGSLGVHW